MNKSNYPKNFFFPNYQVNTLGEKKRWTGRSENKPFDAQMESEISEQAWMFNNIISALKTYGFQPQESDIKQKIAQISDDIKQVAITLKQIVETKKAISIRSLHDKYLILKEPLSISLEYDGFQYTAYATDLNVFGCGETEYESLEDLRKTIIDFYNDLKDAELAPPMNRIWSYLSSVISENES